MEHVTLELNEVIISRRNTATINIAFRNVSSVCSFFGDLTKINTVNIFLE